MSDLNLDSFIAGLKDDLLKTANTPIVDTAKEAKIASAALESDRVAYFSTPAANIIEWAVDPRFLDLDSLYHHVRQYQILRDFFQLRCPLSTCNDQSDEAKDCWGKSKEYLKSENLLRYNKEIGEDVCPNCGSSRSELKADGLIVNYNQMHVIAGMRCLPLDTRIVTNHGYLKIRDLLPTAYTPDTFYKLTNVSVNGINGRETASDVYFSGDLQSKVFTLRNGVEHTTSAVHPMYGYSHRLNMWGWHTPNDFAPGDYIQTALPKKWTGTGDLTEGEATILGYLIAEGSVNSDIKLKFTNGDRDIINIFKEISANIFGYTPSQTVNKTGTCFELSVCNKQMLAKLRKLGLNKSIAHTKIVPESVWAAKESVVASYLRAYFDGDGTVAIENKIYGKNKANKCAISCYTVSRQLALETQQLLLGLGIECSIVKSKSREFGTGGKKFDHDAYSIRIYGNNILKYANKIGFNCSRKKQILDACVSLLASSMTQDDKLVPGASALLSGLYSKLHSKSAVYHKLINVISGKYKSIKASTLDIIIKIAEADGIKSDELLLLKSLINPETRFIRIDSIVDGDIIPMGDLHVPGTHSFTANSVMNHNSGKTSAAAVLGTYLEHLVITYGHSVNGVLAKSLNQLSNQMLEITFIASTDVQSADTIWAKFTGLRSSSPWMQEYVKWIKSLQTAQQTANGMKPWEYAENQKQIINGFLKVKINSLNSNSGGMAGRTRLCAFIDELSRFENSDTARGADEAYRVLENSLASMRAQAKNFPNLPWLGTMISISSPISDDDKAMRLLKQAPEIDGMYYGHYATWEFNPDLPREAFDGQFKKDPVGAMRDFGAKPPTAASPFIVDSDRFRDQVIDRSLRQTAEFKRIIYTDKTGREYVSASLERSDLLRNGERYICFDASSSFDQFAAACAHGEWVETPEGKSLVTVYDWVYRLTPEDKPRRDIWFEFVLSAIEKLSKYCVISRVEFDRWNSTHLIQQIRDKGILCEMRGTTADQFNKFLNDAAYGRIRMLPPLAEDEGREPTHMSPQSLAFYELEHLERSPDLRKVYNPKKGMRRGYDSDDVATVVVHANNMVQGTAISMGTGNGLDARLRRETAGASTWSTGGTLFRSVNNRRGW